MPATSELDCAEKISLDAGPFFATLRHQVLFFPGDLFAKELCRECVCCLVSSLLHPVADVLRGRVAECRLLLHEQARPTFERSGVFKARLILELVRPGTEEGADAQRFYRPTTSPIARSLERDWSAILIPHRARGWHRCSLMTATLLSAAGCLSSAGPGGTSGGLADLIPGHQEAALRKRVEADSFPRPTRPSCSSRAAMRNSSHAIAMALSHHSRASSGSQPSLRVFPAPTTGCWFPRISGFFAFCGTEAAFFAAASG